jgi:hypothetical protein
MKTKLYIAGLILISLITFSCSNDEDSYEVQEVKSNTLKSVPKSVLINRLTAKPIDSINVNTTPETQGQEGDPSNPIPPRPR